MKTKIYSFLVLFLLSVSAFAQSYEVSGTVTDNSNQPLPGVSVVVKGTTTGTSTDFDGKYTLQVNNEDVLVFTFVGFEAQEVAMDGSATVNVIMKSGLELDEVVVIGSRNPNRTATDTPVPVDIIDVAELIAKGPQVNLNQILNFVAPSFTSNTQTISDGTDHVDPASLRGLGPDQVLVLINGKRRHNSSLVNVNGTFGRGSVGTDLNAIPAAAIKRLEVLRDGAAAQYGSDAIAGVINIVLNDNVNELNFKLTSGANFSENANDQTGGVDGEMVNVSINYGVPIGDDGGFINFTGDFDYREDYGRMKEWEGSIFNVYNSIEYVAHQGGTPYDDLSVAQIQFLANNVSNFSPTLQSDISAATSMVDLIGVNDGINSIAGALTNLTFDSNGNIDGVAPIDNTNAELATRGQTRSDYNMRVGQSALRGGRFFANFSLPLDDNGTELYSFAGISSRKGNSAGFYRLPNQSRTYTPVYVNGFLPEINSKVSDKSFAVGIKGKIGDWNVDLSNTWGNNSFLFTIGNTFNASLQNASPTTFDAGGFAFSQNTVNLDINKFHEDVLSGLNIAFGAEYRLENYEIFAGEEPSYSRYTDEGEVITIASQIVSQDFFGRSRPGGSQVFPGFSPDNELSRDRSSIAGYFDVEADFSERFLASFAARFEDYSDFGSTINFKLATLFKATDNLNIRAALNTGFRAPSLHQLNFNSTSTIFDQEGQPVEVGTFANDSRVAKTLGIPKLKEETSQSISVGFTAKIPDANLSITLDGYWVGIDDRVVYTGQFSGAAIAADLARANASAASFFVNAIDTESKGLDVVITHKANVGTNMQLKSDLAGTFSQTRKVGPIKSSDLLRAAGLESTYFPEDSRVYLEEAVPRTKVILSNALSSEKFNIFLRNVYFGEVTEATTNLDRQQIFGTKLVTDLSLGYNFSESLTITVGANNLLDVYPDRAADALADGGNNRSGGRFDWSRRAQQFGIGGRFLFARLSFTLK